jgi:hypothetical protein
MSPAWMSQMAPDHAPPPPGWWPPAPGWWAVGVLALLLLVLLVRRLRSHDRTVRRSALAELQLIRNSDAATPEVARAIQSLLRRYAVAVFGRARVAKLTGDAWLEFVGFEGGAPLAGYAGRSLLAAAFGNHSKDDREHWLAAAETFIKRASIKRAAPTARRRRKT